jgi:hypothetical protein
MIDQPNWKEIALALYESEPCHFDHSGFCQTHYKGYDPDEACDDEKPCPHAVIAAWVKENEE